MSDKARQFMIDSQLRPQGVTERRLLDAFRAVARENYVPEAMRAAAYSDRSIPLGEGQAMLAPTQLAQLMMKLALQPGEKVLIVGPGADYAAALAEAMGAEAVVAQGKAMTAGQPKQAPFDAMLILGAIEELPAVLADQLADGGRMATGLMAGGVTRLAYARKTGASLALDDFADGQMPRLAAFDRKQAFAF